jgi:hypothetical protein
MKRIPACGLVIALIAGGATVSCSKREAKKAYVAMGEYVSPQDTLPRVRYFEDGLMSLNDRCAVRKVKLNSKMPPVYVNGQPVGFC